MEPNPLISELRRFRHTGTPGPQGYTPSFCLQPTGFSTTQEIAENLHLSLSSLQAGLVIIYIYFSNMGAWEHMVPAST